MSLLIGKDIVLSVDKIFKLYGVVDVLKLEKMIIVKNICIMENVMNVIMDIILINLLRNVKIILILMKINVWILYINGHIKQILEEMFLVLTQDQQTVNLLIKIC